MRSEVVTRVIQAAAVSFMFGVLFFVTPPVVRADTFYVGGHSPRWGYDPYMFLYTVNLDSSTYAPGATVNATGEIQTSECANESGAWNIVSLTGTANGSTKTLIDRASAALRTNDLLYSYYAGVYGSATYSAPSAAGNYNLSFTGTATVGGGTESTTYNLPYAVNPLPPASLSSTCSSDGTSVTLNWSASVGANKYHPRVYVNTGSCPDGWTMASDGHTCSRDDVTSTSVTFSPITPGAAYGAWVHAGDPVLLKSDGSWSSTGTPDFACHSMSMSGSFSSVTNPCQVGSGGTTCPVTVQWNARNTNHSGSPLTGVNVIDQSTGTLYKSNPGTWNPIPNVNYTYVFADSSSFIFNLPPGNYTFQLVGYNPADANANSDGWKLLDTKPTQVIAPAACALPWGGTTNDSTSVTAYQAVSVTAPAVCVSETRTCHDGTLGGSYANQTCTPNSADACGPANGSTPTFTEPSGTQACKVGTLNASSPADTPLAWNWSCGGAVCSAPKYGCTVSTDSNYTLSQYGANGPQNDYGCGGTCANGGTDYPTCTPPKHDTCGPASSATPQLVEPSGTQACKVGTLNASSPADTTLAWNWSCGAVTSCTAPKYGCTVSTDSNYTLSQYGANGPQNNYGCGGTCVNGAANYPICTAAGTPTMTGTLTPSAYTCTIAENASSCSVDLTWSVSNPVAPNGSSITSNYPSANTRVFDGDAGSNQSVSISGAYAATGRSFYLYNSGVQLSQATIVPTCAAGTAWNGSACTAAMTGTLTPSAYSCSIALGSSNCTVSLTWSTLHPVDTSAITSSCPPSGATIFTGNSGSGKNVTVSGSCTPTYYLYNNAIPLAQATVVPLCAGGSAWDGSVCAANGLPNTPTVTSVCTPSAACVSSANNCGSTAGVCNAAGTVCNPPADNPSCTASAASGSIWGNGCTLDQTGQCSMDVNWSSSGTTQGKTFITVARPGSAETTYWDGAPAANYPHSEQATQGGIYTFKLYDYSPGLAQSAYPTQGKLLSYVALTVTDPNCPECTASANGPLTPILRLLAPSRVQRGAPFTLTWSAAHVGSCVVTNATTGAPIAASVKGSSQQTIVGQTTFTLTCLTSGEPSSISTVVGLVPMPIEH